jgi:hypothetical protein
MIGRKKSKIYNPNEFGIKERVSLRDKELLRYGLEMGDSPCELKKFSSLKGADDFIINQCRAKQTEIETNDQLL